jgi:hypothetical protein
VPAEACRSTWAGIAAGPALAVRGRRGRGMKLGAAVLAGWPFRAGWAAQAGWTSQGREFGRRTVTRVQVRVRMRDTGRGRSGGPLSGGVRRPSAGASRAPVLSRVAVPSRLAVGPRRNWAVTTGSRPVISLRACQASRHGRRATSAARTANRRASHGDSWSHQRQRPSSRTVCRLMMRWALRHSSRSTTSLGQSPSGRSSSAGTGRPQLGVGAGCSEGDDGASSGRCGGGVCASVAGCAAGPDRTLTTVPTALSLVGNRTFRVASRRRYEYFRLFGRTRGATHNEP